MTLVERKAARTLKLKLPEKGLKPGRYAIQLKFCNRYDYSKMPEYIMSRRFDIH